MQVASDKPSRPPPQTPEEVVAAEQYWLDHVYRGDRLPELTLQVVLVSVLLAALMIAFNIYMGLKTGWGEGGSLIAVILGFAIIRMLGREYSELENNITQTIASAAGSLGNIVNVIPALIILEADGIIEHGPTFVDVLLWVFFTSFLGVFFAIPLRRQMLVIDQLLFPTGTAAAETIEAMHAKGDEAMAKAKALGIIGGASALFTILRDGFHLIPHTIPFKISGIGGIGLHKLTIGAAASPMMLGAGFLVGPRVGTSLAVGGFVAWGIIAPMLHINGIDMSIAETMTKPENLEACRAILANPPITEAGSAQLAADCKYIHQIHQEAYYSVMVKWLMWPGLGIMVAAGLTSTLMKWKILLSAMKSLFEKTRADSPIAHLEFPTSHWIIGLVLSSIGVMAMLQLRFGVPWYLGLLSIGLSFLLAVIAVRATGETDINPVGAMGSVTQIAFGSLQGAAGAANPAAITTGNLLTGGVAAGGASEAADMMQDLKTGWLLGATPRTQVYAQLIGVTIGSVFCACIFWVLIQAAPIGSTTWPAPAAITWSGLATMMTRGTDALPPGAITALAIGIAIGIALPFAEAALGERKWMLPSALGLGVAMVVPYEYAFSIFAGSMILLAIRGWKPAWVVMFAASVGAGGIAGEGLAGVGVAFVQVGLQYLSGG